MKRIIMFSLSLILVACLMSSCTTPGSTSTQDKSSVENTQQSMTKSQAEAKALSELMRALTQDRHANIYFNPNETRYNIATSDHRSYGWVFKGTVSLYDSYGQYAGRGTFDITVYSSGSANCDLDLDVR
ncbi:MAG: hypothetical protein IJT78_02615 [Oscillospiraceae bacterium]|nr:hypothetical protein [Oscillospiraceae bacterium]